MRVDIATRGQTVEFRFTREDGDRDEFTNEHGSSDGRLTGTSCCYVMPAGWRQVDTHPDLFGVVAIGLVGNIAARRVLLPFGVSSAFQECVERIWNIEVGPVDSRLGPRTAPERGRPGLCFSGGVDSFAAMLLLPEGAVGVFLDRLTPQGAPRSIYRKEGAVHACQAVGRTGRDVCRVPTDMEFLRDPVGFVADWTVATPLILVADHYCLDSLAFGTVMESAYLCAGTRYLDYKERVRWWRHAATTAAVGLPWNQVTAGLTEVATSKLVMASPFRGVAQSCIRGAVGAPCENCWKCFRKGLLETALRGETPSDGMLDRYFGIDGARRHLEQTPIKHEDVILYIVQKYTGGHGEMRALRKRLCPNALDLGWVLRWFSPAREVMVPRYRGECEARILRHFEPMSERDLANVYAWNRTV